MLSYSVHTVKVQVCVSMSPLLFSLCGLGSVCFLNIIRLLSDYVLFPNIFCSFHRLSLYSLSSSLLTLLGCCLLHHIFGSMYSLKNNCWVVTVIFQKSQNFSKVFYRLILSFKSNIPLGLIFICMENV